MWVCTACGAEMGDFAQICNSCGAARDAGESTAPRPEGHGKKPAGLRLLRAMAAIWYAWCGLLAAVSVIAGVLIPLKVGGQGKALTFLTMALGSAAFFVTIILVSRKFFIQPMIKKLENIEKDVD